MSLKDTWNDKVNGQDIIDANDINNIAKSVIGLEDQKTLLYKEQSLNETQKNIARSNINAAPIPLIVTVEDGYASHSPTEMYAHTQKCGTVYLYEDDYGYYNTSYGDDGYWWFYYLDVSDDGIYAREYEIQADKSATIYETDVSNNGASPVKSVNGKTGEVNLSAEDVGALPDTTEIPKTAADVDADPSGTANQRVSEHNVSSESHTDIRLAISTLRDRLNAFLDIDDTTKDQVSEIIALIEDNSELIDSITTSKVSVSDIVNNLSTNVTDKPLSAAQGVVLRLLIENIKVPTKLSELSGDTTHRVVTDAEKNNWNAKSNFSGKYDDLEGTPDIPEVPTSLKNPYSLTITLGNDSYTYDGSKAVSIAIDDGNGVAY